ncbi:MAG: hypothetical protein ACTHQQ_05410 [Solirubrobacteraceae bacterium]
MAGTTARLARVFLAAGSIVLVSAGAATAATFKSDSGKLAASNVSGVTASGGTLSFSGTANPTGSTKFAGQIDFTTGQATGLGAPGTLTLKHSGKTAKLNVTTISGTTLSAKLGSKSLTFPLSYSGATTTPNSKFTGVSVSGVAVNLSSADASALNAALNTTAYKSGKKFGTLSYSGIDRELIETSSGGPLTLCDAKKFDTQNAANGVVVSPVSPATPNTSDCTGSSKEDGIGLNFPEAGKTFGFIDTATGNGRITVKGGLLDTQSSSGHTGKFTSPIFDLLGSTKSVLSAVVNGNGVSLGRQTVATVAITKAPSLTTSKSGGTFTIPAGGTTVALNNTSASLLDGNFCTPSSSCKGGAYTAGEAIGYSGGMTDFK